MNILFLIFNRPDLTHRVFARIRQARPSRLFISADGPRQGSEVDILLCNTSRAITSRVDWKCELRTQFHDTNQGCRIAVSTGISWFFQHVDRGIILEDDCLPDPSFFDFCQVLLEYYRNDKRIMAISGNNFQPFPRTDYSYYFSRYPHVWGWATWRRAWQHYDFSLTRSAEFVHEGLLASIVQDPDERSFWKQQLALIDNGTLDTWDVAWIYSCWNQNGLAILPEVNLVSNIGFGHGATHTKHKDSPCANMPAVPMREIRHPPYVVAHCIADAHTARRKFMPNNIVNYPGAVGLRHKLYKWFRRTHSHLREHN